MRAEIAAPPRCCACAVAVIIISVASFINSFVGLEISVGLTPSAQLAKTITIKEKGDNTSPPSRSRSSAASSFENSTGIVPTAFARWNGIHQLPCYPGGLQGKETKRSAGNSGDGFYFLKVAKCASSTGASVTLRIARNVAKRTSSVNNVTMCRVQARHATGRSIRWINNKENGTKRSFVWTMIRRPTSRLVSLYFFSAISRRGRAYSDEAFTSFLRRGRNFTNHIVQGLAPKPIKNYERVVPDAMNAILHESYDFIGLAERMDESIVALQMILGLQASDVLFLNSKTAGGYDDGSIGNRCTYIQKSYVTPTMKEYFESPDYKRSQRNDELLYKAVNRSLDLTIDELGYDRFREKLYEFRALKSAVSQSSCAASVRFPCSATGKKRKPAETDCFRGDWGCGFSCIDHVVNSYKLPRAYAPFLWILPVLLFVLLFSNLRNYVLVGNSK